MRMIQNAHIWQAARLGCGHDLRIFGKPQGWGAAMTSAIQLDFYDQAAGQCAALPTAARLCSLEALPESVPDVRIGSLVEQFVEWSSSRRKPGTIKTYEKSRRAAERIGTVEGVHVLEQTLRRASSGWCQKVHDALTERSGPCQADNSVKLLQAAWEHAAKRGDAPRQNPWKSVARNGSKPPPLHFPKNWVIDWLDLMERAPDDGVLPRVIADIFIVETVLAGRIWSEIRTMKWEDVREDAGIIVFPDSKEELRSVPIELLGERGRAALERQRGKHDVWVWPGARGRGPIGETTCHKHWPAVREYAKAQGLMFERLDGKPLVIHHLRHAFNDYCASVLKLPEEVVMQFLGHKDKRSSRRYTHWHPDHLREHAKLVAATIGGGKSNVVAAKKAPGLSRDRVARAIRHLGGSRKVAEIDEWIAARINDAQPEAERVGARAVTGWRQRQRTPPHDIVDLLARWIAASVGWSESTALGWLFGYGSDDLPSPRPALRVVG